MSLPNAFNVCTRNASCNRLTRRLPQEVEEREAASHNGKGKGKPDVGKNLGQNGKVSQASAAGQSKSNTTTVLVPTTPPMPAPSHAPAAPVEDNPELAAIKKNVVQT